MATVIERWNAWWFTPVSTRRIHRLRLLAYAFIPIDVLLTTRWIAEHRFVPGGLYRPLLIGRLFPIPAPTAGGIELVRAVLLAATVAALVSALARRHTAWLGWTVALAYLSWMVIGQSYGKVDHDRFAFLVLLFVLPTVRPGGHDHAHDHDGLSDSAGWAVRMVQVGVVATYVLAAWAKLRFGGWGWANGATLTRAVLRRGTAWADWTLDVPGFLRAFQWFILAFEFGAVVLLFVRPRRVNVIVALLFAFHLMTYLMLRIVFLPHLVAMAAFLPLEQIRRGEQIPRDERNPQPSGKRRRRAAA